MPELREQLAETVWADKEKAFRRYRRDLTSAAREAIKRLEAAAEANFTLAKLRDAASRELGNHVTQIPLLLYAGLLLPDLVAIWHKHTERALGVLEQAELPRPAVPTPVNNPRLGPVFPRPGSVVAARVSSRVSAPSGAEAAQEGTLPVPQSRPEATGAPRRPASARPAPDKVPAWRHLHAPRRQPRGIRRPRESARSRCGGKSCGPAPPISSTRPRR